jgi:hypothetical protein
MCEAMIIGPGNGPCCNASRRVLAEPTGITMWLLAGRCRRVTAFENPMSERILTFLEKPVTSLGVPESTSLSDRCQSFRYRLGTGCVVRKSLCFLLLSSAQKSASPQRVQKGLEMSPLIGPRKFSSRFFDHRRNRSGISCVVGIGAHRGPHSFNTHGGRSHANSPDQAFVRLGLT